MGGEGKSILLKALISVFSSSQVFAIPQKGNFALFDILKSKVCFWDEWRFDQDIVPWPIQCLLYDGSEVPINRPQNDCQQKGHTKYDGTSPFFVTTKLSDVEDLLKAAACNPETGAPFNSDASMIARRLKVYEYRHRIPKPPAGLSYCGKCFSNLVLQHAV